MKYYVALVEGGVPKFSDSPVAHNTRREARIEAERLAALHPGQAFDTFAASSIGPSKVPPKPVEPTYSLDELYSTAPNGTYEAIGGVSPETRIIIMGRAGVARAVMFHFGHLFESLNKVYWAGLGCRYRRAAKQLTVTVQ
jgi:hypothetical protein